MSSSENLKIPLEDILSATNRFSEANLIAWGGYGKVYLGRSKQHGILAVKRLVHRTHGPGQGGREFWMEISLLSAYKHENLVALVGFCEEGSEKILVYKYETNGSLDKHLHKKDLTWVRRLQICIDAARGLRYLHDEVGSGHRVIHRDVKSGNILLDENWKAKISDFGLSKIALANVPFSVQFSNACGTYGYVDPEFLNSALTQKSDVYSFGVVLFEVLFGKLVSDPPLLDAGRFTVEMAQNHYENNKLDELIDPDLRIQLAPASLRIYSTVAYQCLKNRGGDRPTMRLVVEELEKALGHQESVELLHRHKALSGFSHDVCISFRKGDLDYELVDMLCKALEKKGLSVYKDNIYHGKESLPLEAIRRSRSSVIVFTTHFAGSSCCLDETAKIMECQQERKQVVLPIYYDVEKSDVRGGECFRNGLWKRGLIQATTMQGGLISHAWAWGGTTQEAASRINDQLSGVKALRSDKADVDVSNIKDQLSRELRCSHHHPEHQPECHHLKKNPGLSGFSHDVCISFRKDDLEDYRVELLCKALEKQGLCVYKDNIYHGKESLPLEAIEQSKSSIIVFSKRFADSSWCLDEVVKIMECLKERKQVVMPIYHGVDESYVSTKSWYINESLLKGNNKNKRIVWRDAHFEASKIQGGIISDGFEWQEGVTEVASRIKSQLSGEEALKCRHTY